MKFPNHYPMLLLFLVLLSCGCSTDIATGEPSSSIPQPATEVANNSPSAGTDPATEEFSSRAVQALQIANTMRTEGCRCGNKRYRPTTPLKLNAQLMVAADRHSRDMARNQDMDHRGSDGSSVGDRVTKAGYRWSAVAENIAWNQRSVAQALDSWKRSPGHCENIMNPDYEFMGFSEKDWYWTQVFAR